MTVKSPPVFLQSGSYVAQDLRQMVSGQAAPGVIHPGDFIISAGGGMSVNVSAGSAFVAGTETTTQGTYYVVNDAPVNLAVAASNPTNARNDLVILRVRDAAISGAFNDAALVVVTGVASGTPVDPAVPNNSVILGRLVIPALAASVIAGYITDIRQMAIETWPSQATTGLIGAQAGTRMAGATNGGAPTTGTFAIGDMVVDRTKGRLWMCSAAGTPGTWLLMGNGPGCHVSGTGQVMSTATWGAMALSIDVYNADAMHSTVTNNSRVTIVVPGRYSFTAAVQWSASNAGYRGVGLRKNGAGATSPDIILSYIVNLHAVDTPIHGGAATYNLVAGDYVELCVFQNSGGNLGCGQAGDVPYLTAQWVAN